MSDRVSTDRTLLFGILAVQMDFISRDALVGATNAWVSQKDKPLGEVLVERGELAKARRDLLEGLVDEHVRAHAGDAARSLQAISSAGDIADDLQHIVDEQIQASLGYVRRIASLTQDYSGVATTVLPPLGPQTFWTGRFRIVRPHAKGGLGIVSIAMDDELDREVAFKEIKHEFAEHQTSRARFVLEAEITGKLEHPGIVPIYGLGHAPDGSPFYAMRFIRGDSLADAINRFHDPAGPFFDPVKRSLELRELLGRFLDVCDAMAYAHSRGVLHRDLKPGNVMLGPFGETLVVDWGLALALERVPEGHDSAHGAIKPTKTDSSSLPNEEGAVVGTLAYMPPEQAEGNLDKLGPRSDVYGLGAILYDLLTGKFPNTGDSLADLLKSIRDGRITPPRQIRPDISPSLEAVCLKAPALDPQNRYASPRNLGADIKAWLANEPVSARREPFSEPARRWAKRNKTAVTGLAAALLVGLIGFGAVAAVQTRARNTLDAKNQELDGKNTELVKANADLNLARTRAEDREDQAIDAVKKFRDAIVNEPELKASPALESLRKRLLKEPLAFFRTLRERLQADQDTRPDSLNRLAAACFDLVLLTNEIGDKRDALLEYRDALAIHQKLETQTPPSWCPGSTWRTASATWEFCSVIPAESARRWKPIRRLLPFGKS